MGDILFAALAVLLAAASAACFKIGDWHRQESAYWSDVAWKVRLNPKLDEHYRPILRAAQRERPSILARLRQWTPPDERVTS